MIYKIKSLIKNYVRPNKKFDFKDLVDHSWKEKTVVMKSLIKLMEDAKVYLEFGAGKSTILAYQHMKNGHIFTIDSDKHFLNSCKQYLSTYNSTNKIDYIHADIGLTTNWGYPLFGYKKRHFGFSFGGNHRKWKKYSEHGWSKLKSIGLSPDLIFIDGRFRVSCVLKSLSYLPKDSRCMLLLDDYRDHYKVIEPYITNFELKGNTLFFKKGQKELNCDHSKFEKYFIDPR